MMKEEFEKLIGKKVEEKEYKVIEFVYTWHPSITDKDGKNQIATIYKNFGIRVICDMMETAEEAERLINNIEYEKSKIALHERNIESLRNQLTNLSKFQNCEEEEEE